MYFIMDSLSVSCSHLKHFYNMPPLIHKGDFFSISLNIKQSGKELLSAKSTAGHSAISYTLKALSLSLTSTCIHSPLSQTSVLCIWYNTFHMDLIWTAQGCRTGSDLEMKSSLLSDDSVLSLSLISAYIKADAFIWWQWNLQDLSLTYM